mgnify:CR=1 FL=1
MNEIIKTNGNDIIDSKICAEFAELEKQIKILTEKEKAVKTQILQAMEDNGVIKIDNDRFTITYVAATDRESFDSKTFRAENPALYDAYVKIVPVAPSLRIKIK